MSEKEIAEIEWRAKRFHAKSADVEKLLATVKELRQQLFAQDVELQLLRPLKDKLEDLTSSRIVQSQEIQITDLEEKVKEQRELLRKALPYVKGDISSWDADLISKIEEAGK